MTNPLGCPHCGEPVFRSAAGGDKLKARTSILVLHKAGAVEINCESCRKGVLVPLVLKEDSLVLRKAEPRLVVPKA